MARGSHGHGVYADGTDRERFLETLGEACQKTGWWVYACVLVANHYRLLLETPERALVKGLDALGLRSEELEAMARGAPEKQVLAWWLRRSQIPRRLRSGRLSPKAESFESE